jgi:hypothetical protein
VVVLDARAGVTQEIRGDRMIPTVPVARGCPRCGGWFTRRALHPEEPPSAIYQCAWCGEDIAIRGGIPVSLAYSATPETMRLLARHEHAANMLQTSIQRRERRRATKEESA